MGDRRGTHDDRVGELTGGTTAGVHLDRPASSVAADRRPSLEPASDRENPREKLAAKTRGQPSLSSADRAREWVGFPSVISPPRRGGAELACGRDPHGTSCVLALTMTFSAALSTMVLVTSLFSGCMKRDQAAVRMVDAPAAMSPARPATAAAAPVVDETPVPDRFWVFSII